MIFTLDSVNVTRPNKHKEESLVFLNSIFYQEYTVRAHVNKNKDKGCTCDAREHPSPDLHF